MLAASLAATALALLAVSAGTAAATLAPTPHTGVCFIDGNGNQARDSADLTYVQVDCSRIATGDVRLVASPGGAGGMVVGGLEWDAGRPAAATTMQYAFIDAGRTSGYDFADAIFLHAGPLPGSVGVGDIRLSGPDAFTTVEEGSSERSLGLLAAPVAVGGESFQELDGYGGYTTGDRVFLDLDGSGGTSIGDLILAGPGAGTIVAPPGQQTTPPAGTGTSTQTSTQAQPASPTDATTATTQPASDSTATDAGNGTLNVPEASGSPAGTGDTRPAPAGQLALVLLAALLGAGAHRRSSFGRGNRPKD